MRLRPVNRSKGVVPPLPPLGGSQNGWESVFRLVVAAAVVVPVTLHTGSAQDGALAVSAVAAAAQLLPSRPGGGA
jgi:hypothetical protein